ncbi:lysophospholipid acyltransferase family protein [Campylobacter ureolyticus]|uniref:lysophospholipid acyltransferase family protein n=1 Tax=Campylobacter ureolyticus TaxID=827 RepID=UPI0022B4FC51|nr:lysophospholipid acyltransferase family protein [Campylobacter ureolyticus]MCZ6134618.1 lysophospholipid acyltransferase family protein [Campylobacter ureolyticus]
MAKSSLKLFFIKWIAYLVIWIIYLTCKKKFTPTNLPSKPCVVVFWHGRLAMMSFAYRHWWSKTFNKQKQGKVIISDHKDGEIITQIISKFGIGAIRGSSSKGGARALINAFKEIRNGVDVIITPDGPRGPKHSVADGAVIIAQKQHLEIYALNYEASRFWQFKSWDEMILPKPFSTIYYSLSKPFSVENLELDVAKEKIKNELLKLAEK